MNPHAGVYQATPDLPFADIVKPRLDGGVQIELDHPAGPLKWELPGERAVQLRDAIDNAIGKRTERTG
jgi:hypothetical protein